MVFKREKEISRSLEFDGMWIAEQPSDDDIRGHWDKLVISTGSFADKYWDPFVKKKVGLPPGNGAGQFLQVTTPEPARGHAEMKK